MILGASNQNKNLSSQGLKPKDTSHRVTRVNKYSAKIAKSQRGEKANVESAQTATVRRPSDKIKGSYEGLDRGKSTVISMNGSGYDNPTNQQARNEKINRQNVPMSSRSEIDFNSSSQSSIINNYTGMTMQGSSSDRISKIVKTNNYFS
jgi:hypothetical protein